MGLFKYKGYVDSKDIPSEFETIYEDLYNNHITVLEDMRKKVRWRTVVQNIFLVFSIIGYVFAELDSDIIFDFIPMNIYMSITIIGVVSIPLFVLMAYLNKKYKDKYLNFYKNEILNNFIKLINSKLIYRPNSIQTSASEIDYIKSNFDDRDFNIFTMDDWIEGNLTEDIYAKLYDIDVKKQTGSGKSRHVETFFQGIFAITQCNKNIGTFVRISKNKSKVLHKNFRVEMDSEEFEKYFDVHSDDKILAMRILTSDIMESLTDFYTKYNLPFEIIFRRSTIYLRFFTGPMFEPKVFGSSMDKELLVVYYAILKFIVEVTTKVNIVLQEIEI